MMLPCLLMETVRVRLLILTHLFEARLQLAIRSFRRPVRSAILQASTAQSCQILSKPLIRTSLSQACLASEHSSVIEASPYTLPTKPGSLARTSPWKAVMLQLQQQQHLMPQPQLRNQVRRRVHPFSKQGWEVQVRPLLPYLHLLVRWWSRSCCEISDRWGDDSDVV